MVEGSRRRRRVDDDDEDDISALDHKRVKSGGQRYVSEELGDGKALGPTSSESPDTAEGSDDDAEEASTPVDEAPAQMDGKPVRSRGASALTSHRPGSIVRVRVTNFVTYSYTEFLAGPRLNMIIGPNGTGKSTFVCAVCLGLGWGPQVLGRARDVADFIKHGCRQAVIEIELQGRPGKKNPVVSRTIRRDGSKNSFAINGKPVPQKKVLELARSYSIQIDNLCQFLPQDKVAEFAAMSPVELLRSTQRAAAPPQMLQWHEELVELRKSQKEALGNHVRHKAMLADLERKHESQREEVERVRQRADIKKRIEQLEQFKPVVLNSELARQAREAKEQARALKAEEEELKSQVAPILESANAKKQYYRKLEAVVRQRRHAVSVAQATAERAGDHAKQLEDKIDDLTQAINNERGNFSKFREEKQKLTQSINRIQRQLEEEEPEFNAATYNERLRDLVRQIRDLDDKLRELESQRSEANQRHRNKDNEIQSLENRHRNLESQSGQREEMLRHVSMDTYNAWQWVKENQDKFQNQVFGPPLVECSVRDLQYADIVESVMGRNDFQAFTTQSRDDFRTLQRAFAEHRWQDVSIRTTTVSLEQLRPPVGNDELERLGFEHWVKDLLTGPEPVIAMLCSESNLHSVPVTLRELSEAEYNAMEGHARISSWVSGSNTYQVTRRREYGPGAVSTRVRSIGKAKWWTNQPIDTGARTELERRIRQAREELTEIERLVEDAGERKRQLLQEAKELRIKEREIKKEKEEKQRAVVAYRGLPDRLENHKAKLKTIDDQVRELRKETNEMRSKQDELALTQAQATVEHANTVIALREAIEACFEMEIKLREAMSDYETLNARNRDINESLAEKTRVAHDAIREYKAIDHRRKAAEAEVTRLRERYEREGEVEAFEELARTCEGFTRAELESQIDAETAKLDLTHDAREDIFEEFSRREVNIGKLRRQIGEEVVALGEVEEAIARTRGVWEPRLEGLVSQISAAFSESFARIGCAGQVGIDKAEDTEEGEERGNALSREEQGSGSDFDQWSIQIMVKFRESEPLSVLDAHRQSGGERAVSTIFYLMALQSLSESPFRVVDEINQGMDPRNERMVHERMVGIACDEAEDSGGQYFLITPKVLTGLAYQEGMRVSCIFSGEYMPEDYEKTNAQRCIGKMKRFLQVAAALPMR